MAKAAKKPAKPHRGGKTVGTDQKKEQVLAFISEGCSITGACRQAGVGRSTLYTWMQEDPALKEAVDQAYVEGTEYIADNLTTRAIRGDTTASIFILKSRDPAKYREKYEVAGSVTGTLSIVWGSEGARPETPSVQNAMKEGKLDDNG